MRKSHIFVPPERERERDALDNPRHIRMRWRTLLLPPSGFVCRAGRAAGSIPLGLCMSPFVLVSTGEGEEEKKKKLFSIDLRAPTPPTRSLTSTTLWLFFSLFRYERKEERGGRCKVKVESCGDYRTDGSVNFEFCWPFYFCRRRKQKREGERTSCHLSNTFSIMTSFFPLEIFFFLLFMGEFPVVFEQL